MTLNWKLLFCKIPQEQSATRSVSPSFRYFCSHVKSDNFFYVSVVKFRTLIKAWIENCQLIFWLAVFIVTLLQLRIQAQDGGFPPKVSEVPATLIINVIRNKYTPEFSESSYTANIRMNLGFGNRVVQLETRDGDPEVVFPVFYFIFTFTIGSTLIILWILAAK